MGAAACRRDHYLFALVVQLEIPSDKLRHVVPVYHLSWPTFNICLIEPYPEVARSKNR